MLLLPFVLFYRNYLQKKRHSNKEGARPIAEASIFFFFFRKLRDAATAARVFPCIPREEIQPYWSGAPPPPRPLDATRANRTIFQGQFRFFRANIIKPRLQRPWGSLLLAVPGMWILWNSARPAIRRCCPVFLRLPLFFLVYVFLCRLWLCLLESRGGLGWAAVTYH